ncbi:MAG: hypothetical protein AAFX06_20845 [Planctomycetota bacterium]
MRLAAGLLLTALVAVRFVGLGHVSVPDRSVSRDALLAEIETAEANAVRYEFLHDAAVILGVGRDGQPGRKRVDDNANGIFDDPNELGAVGSDDECLLPTDDGYETTFQHPLSIVISRGAFVPAKAEVPGEREIRFRLPSVGWFVP